MFISSSIRHHHEREKNVNKGKLISMALLAIGVTVMACKTGSTPIMATKCYVVQGERARYLEVDGLARSLASARGFEIAGHDSSALVLSQKNLAGKVVMTSPFGTYVSIISFFEGQQRNDELDLMLEELASGIRNMGLAVERCDSIPGLRTPSIPSEAINGAE